MVGPVESAAKLTPCFGRSSCRVIRCRDNYAIPTAVRLTEHFFYAVEIGLLDSLILAEGLLIGGLDGIGERAGVKPAIGGGLGLIEWRRYV